MSHVKEYHISIPKSTLERLKQKLALSDFPNPSPESSSSSWDQGPPLEEIKRLAQYWQNGYDWRAVEASLNKLPNYIASVNVEGFGTFDIHHIHRKSSQTDAIPLLFLHGWPGSFLEVTKMLDDLAGTQGQDSPAFHIVAPSLIDCGFSSASTVGLIVMLRSVTKADSYAP